MRIFGLILAGMLIAPAALAQKTVVTYGPTGAPPASTDPDEARREKMAAAASKLIVEHECQRALDEKLTPLIREYESIPRKNNPRVYSARSAEESLYYMLDSATKDDQAVALGYTYGYAYYLSAFAQTELQHPIEAEALLRKAVELSPMNSLFLSELGFHIQQTGNSAAALEMFKRAESASEYTPEVARTFEKARALRGQGYALVELRRLDDAEAAYNAALKLEPGDKKSQDELEYIRQQRAKH